MSEDVRFIIPGRVEMMFTINIFNMLQSESEMSFFFITKQR